MVVTLTQLPEQPFGHTYTQYSRTERQASDGSVQRTSNGGCAIPCNVMPPPLDVIPPQPGNPGECLQLTIYKPDGTVPVSREFGCTGLTPDLFEHAHFMLTQRPGQAYWGTAQITMRPSLPAWGNDPRDVALTSIVIRSIDDLLGEGRNFLQVPGVFYTPLNFIDLHGQHYLYTYDADPSLIPYEWRINRYQITEAFQAMFDPTFYPTVVSIDGGLGSVAMDTDHTMLGFEDPWPPETQVNIWRSPDFGRTWTTIVLTIPAPAGFQWIGDCRATVGPGGVVERPLWGLCQAYKSLDWSTPGNWVQFLWQQPGANVPSNFLTAPVAWPVPATPTPTPAMVSEIAPTWGTSQVYRQWVWSAR